MSWTIDATYERRHLEKAFGWYQEWPSFLRHSVDYFCNAQKAEFIESLAGGRNYAGHEDDEFKVLIHAEIKSKDVVEGHLFCKPQTNLDLVVSTIKYAKEILLKDYQLILCQVARKHKTLNGIMDSSGFADTGLRAWQSIYKERLVEIRYYAAGVY